MDKLTKEDTKNNKLKDKITIAMKNTKSISTTTSLFAIILLFGIFLLVGGNTGFTVSETEGYKSLKNNNTKITFTGDVSPSRYLKEVSKKYGHDIFYKDIKDIWKDSDISLINLEATVLEDDPDEVKYEKIDKPTEIYLDIGRKDIKSIKDSGINLIGLANNHSMDYGVQGMNESMEILGDEGVEFTGAGKNAYEAFTPYTKEIDGRSIAIMATTDIGVRGTIARSNMPGVNSFKYRHIEYEIEKMIKNNDFNIIYIHWGTEYTIKPDKRIQQIGRDLIDMGVDVVVGSHPHVLLPIEKYNDGMIIYSMGNLVLDQKTDRTTDSAIANLYLGDNERYFEFIPIDIKDGIPHKTDNKRSVKRIFNSLTKELDKKSYEIKDDKLIIEF